MVTGYVAKSTMAKISCVSCKQMFGSRELESLNLDIDSNVLCYFDTINRGGLIIRLTCCSIQFNVRITYSIHAYQSMKRNLLKFISIYVLCVFFNVFFSSNLYLYNTVLFCVNKDIIIIMCIVM